MQGDLQYAGLFSKVRALYAKRLKAEDYRRLSNMRSLSDAVTYLKRFPGWADILSSVDEFNIRRGYLESVIKRAYFQEQERLLHFIPRKDRPLMEFSIPRYEIELILSFLRFFTLGHLEDFSTDLPPSF